MAFEESKTIASTLHLIYPADTFIAFKPNSTAKTHHISITGNSSSMRINKLYQSTGDSESDDSLKSLVQRLVYESRDTKDSCERATSLFVQIENMLPNRFANVVVVPSTENERPAVYGPSKGCAAFWEAEFGDHVFIVLT